MPAVAIVGAAAAWGLGGAAAIGSVVAGTATLATALTAVATVGATLGAIGAVTGDKTLGTIGTIMGAVGGVGSLAANAGLFGEAATTESLFGSNVSSVDGDLAMAGQTSKAITGTAADSLTPAPSILNGESTNIVASDGDLDMAKFMPTDQLSQATAKTAGDADTLVNGSTSGGGANGIKTITSDTVSDWNNQITKGAGGGSLPSGSPTDPASLKAVGQTGSSASDLGLPAKGQYVGEVSTANDGTPVTWNGTNWAKQDGGFFSGLMKSPLTQYGIVQAAGSFLSGAFDPLKPAQVDAYNAQAAANRAASAINTQQAANMNAPLPVATRGAIGGGGLINNAPAVTGKVA